MIKPDDETNTALARLTRTAEWEKVERWLAEAREAYVISSLNSDDAKSRQAQGSLMAIDGILKATRAAESLTRR